jgi:hypothetical protein
MMSKYGFEAIKDRSKHESISCSSSGLRAFSSMRIDGGPEQARDADGQC